MTIATVAVTCDNSGARRVRCIKVYGKPGRGHGAVGDLLKVIVLQLRNRGFIRVKCGSLQLALVVRTTTPIRRASRGVYCRFDHNAVVLLQQKGKGQGALSHVPVGTRVFGPCPQELRQRNFLKVLSLCTGLL